jgi:hypothetical protein
MIVPEPLALKAIADRECGLGRTVAEVKIRAHGNGTERAVDRRSTTTVAWRAGLIES